MAEVFRATQPGFGGFEKTVAIKRMFSEYAHDEKFVEMLTDEAKIVSQLAHPNVVQILDIGRVHEDYYIAFEFIDGVDLFRLLQRHYELEQDLPIPLAIYVLAELCTALDHAHARCTADGRPMHIIHRDVSPQNVLLSYQGEVKLTDFGIAKAAYRFTHTQAGVVKGKLYYMSPEQARGEKLDHRSDLFSAGILLWELLCTRPLYDEEDQGRLLSAVGSASYRWPADKKERVPPALLAVTEQALNREPDKRFQSGREFRDALMAVADLLGQRCDREGFGAYVRGIYKISDDRPPQIRSTGKAAAFADRQSGEHWVSTIARLPAEQADAAGSPPPIPVDPGPPSRPPTTVKGRRSASGEVPAAAVDDDEPPPLDAILMPTTKPLSQHRREQAEALIAPPLEVASAARPVPDGIAADDVDEDESTAMIDLGEIQRRLEGGGPPPVPTEEPAPEAPTVGMDVVKVAEPASPPEPPPEPDSEASTRFVPAMQGEVAPARPNGPTSKPRVRPARPPRRSLPPRVATPVAEPVWVEPGEEPASWSLLGLTAAVWAGVLILGVYATLLVVSR